MTKTSKIYTFYAATSMALTIVAGAAGHTYWAQEHLGHTICGESVCAMALRRDVIATFHHVVSILATANSARCRRHLPRAMYSMGTVLNDRLLTHINAPIIS